ncbi:hypothetical protein DV735_g3170, partial [Chaetothyriales sp. CBS 134920]
MSNFKAKNLTYDKSQPAFLQRLRAEFGSGERNNVQFERGKKPSRLQFDEGEDDDGPTIVDERGEGGPKGDDAKKKNDGDGAGIGNVKRKRKVVGKVVGSKEEERKVVGKVVGSKEEERKVVGKVVRSKEEERKVVGKVVGSKEEEEKKDVDTKASGTAKAAPKRKAKKIKLSFDD